MVCIKNSVEIDILSVTLTLLNILLFDLSLQLTDYIGRNQTIVGQMALVTIQFQLDWGQKHELIFKFQKVFSMFIRPKTTLGKKRKIDAE